MARKSVSGLYDLPVVPRGGHIEGLEFVWLTVLRKTGKKSYAGPIYDCKCRCGIIVEVPRNRLISGITKSCGCLLGEAQAGKPMTHGYTCGRTRGVKTCPEYNAWHAMVQRCTNPNCKYYEYYGGRGITVDPAWIGRGGFARFIETVGPRPSKGYELDRYPDNNKGYCPGNVRWATRDEQHGNKRNNVMFTHGGVTLCLAAWIRKLSLDPEKTRGIYRKTKNIALALGLETTS